MTKLYMFKLTLSKSKNTAALLLMLFMAITNLSAQTTRYIRAGGSGDGSDWMNASYDLQGIINASDAGDQIWVAAGTYQANWMQSFAMKEGVAIYGGFPDGDDALWSDRNGVNNVTTLTGNNATVINNPPGLTTLAILDGFSIRDGYGTEGGGINVTDCSPTLSNLIIENNTAVDGTGGGGIYISNASPVITNVTILSNATNAAGGGLFIDAGGMPVLTNCYIRNNSATTGGGVLITNDGAPAFRNVLIADNIADYATEMYISNASPEFINITMAGYTDTMMDIGGNGTILFKNSILWGQIYNYGQATYTNCLVKNGFDADDIWTSSLGTDGGFNIDADPIFTDPTSGNYQLETYSPALNSGNDSFYPGGAGNTDVLGYLRFYGTIDIGAYETNSDFTPITTRYVRQDATGHGYSPYSPSGDLQGVLNTTLPGQQVWVSGGNYYPAFGQSFAMKEGVQILGGFPASGPMLDYDRNLLDNPSILHGNGAAVIANVYDPLTSASLLDGFTITEGSGDIGGILNAYCSPSFSNLIITGNNGSLVGGVQNVYGSPSFTNIAIHGNTAGDAGGGMLNYEGAPVLLNCTIYNNTATNIGGGIHNAGNVAGSLTNVAITGNTAFQGGGFSSGESSASLLNVTIAGNTAEYGSAIKTYGSNFTVKNSVIDGTFDGTEGNVEYSYSILPVVDGTDWDPSVGTDGGNNILGNPLFTNAANGDYTLQLASPARNTGNTAFYTDVLMATDLAGNPRLFDESIDMGAYENQTRLPRTYYVRQGATGDGLSWSTASGDLQATIDMASATDKVWVAEGEYQPAADSSFAMKESVAIYGGFEATGSPQMADRDWRTYVTILKGNGNSVIFNEADAEITELAILDGFTITEGEANALDPINLNGGGIFNRMASPTLRNLEIKNNTGVNGGGLSNTASSPVISYCIIRDNTASENGGGICNSDGSQPQIINTLMYNNTSVANGGGMYNISSSTTIVNTTISGNIATFGSLMYNTGSGTTIANSILYGGTIENDAAMTTYMNSLVEGSGGSDNWNTAVGEDYGFNIDADPLFTDAGNNDYTLQSGSPALNGANTGFYNSYSIGAKDLAGNPRQSGANIDMGAYEVALPSVTHYVMQGAAGSGDSWADASGSLADMINASNYGDMVWVAEGDYTTDYAAPFVMKEGVKIYGGFPSNGNPAIEDRIWNTYVTTLRGFDGNVIYNGSGLTTEAVIDGFTLTSGYGPTGGGGIYNDGASPLLMNLIIKNNYADYGAGIYNKDSSPVLVNVIITANQGNSGVAMYNFNSSPTLLNVTIANNPSEVGIGNDQDSFPVFINSIIRQGISNSGGSAPHYAYSNIQESIEQTEEGGWNADLGIDDGNNIDGTTNFNTDLSIMPGSDDINAGSTAKYDEIASSLGFATAAGSKDIGGNPRLFGMAIDIGAFEEQGLPEIYTRYVKVGGAGTEDGTSWADASGDLQQMINMSLPESEVWVAEGNYVLAADESFKMKSSVAIYGGFPANNDAADLTDRDWNEYETILTGDGTTSVVRNDGYDIYNNAILDGFTITGGGGMDGGGIYNSNVYPMLSNLVIKGNVAERGAAIYNVGANPMVVNVIMKDNESLFNNGAFYNFESYPDVVNALIVDNIGGGVYNDRSAPNLTNATIVNNTEFGISNNGGSTPAVRNCIVWNNSMTNLDTSEDIPEISFSIVTGSGGSDNWDTAVGSDYGFNLDVDPGFTDDENDFTLTEGSPAINGGNELSITQFFPDVMTDLAGNDRFINNIEIGAYEYQLDGPCSIVTIWNGSSWDNGMPDDILYAAIIEGDYNTGINELIIACSLTINSGNVVIEDGGNVAVLMDVVVNGGSLTFENNTNLVQGMDIPNTGSITYKKNSSALYNFDYTMWSSPLSGPQTLKQFSPETLDTRFYIYNTELNAYSNYESASGIFDGNPDDGENHAPDEVTFMTGKGYLIRMPDGWSETDPESFEGVFTGMANNGNISIPVSDLGNNYNAVGNPYPSAVNVKQFLEANEDNLDNGTLYFWRKRNGSAETTYATLTLAGYIATSAESDTSDGQFEIDDVDSWVINPGQGFFIKAADNAIEITFDNSMRAYTTNGQFFRMSQNGIAPPPPTTPVMSNLWLNITNDNGNFGQAAVAYSNVTTMELDYGYDGRLLNDGSLSLYTIAADTKLSIQARADFEDTDEVPLGYKTAVAGNFTISLDQVTGLFEEGQDIYVRDNTLGVTQELTGGGTYTFASEIGTFTDRFDVIYATPLGTGVPVIDANSIVIYQKDNVITFNSGTSTMESIKIYDVRGRLIYARNNVNESETAIADLKAQQEMLIVEVTTAEGSKVSKKIIY